MDGSSSFSGGKDSKRIDASSDILSEDEEPEWNIISVLVGYSNANLVSSKCARCPLEDEKIYASRALHGAL